MRGHETANDEQAGLRDWPTTQLFDSERGRGEEKELASGRAAICGRASRAIERWQSLHICGTQRVAVVAVVNDDPSFFVVHAWRDKAHV